MVVELMAQLEKTLAAQAKTPRVTRPAIAR